MTLVGNSMQQYQVPQFITIEDRIIGPLTLKQFFYLLGGAGIALLIWFLFKNTIVFIIIAVPLAGLFVGLAFAKINERPLPVILLGAVSFYLKPRLYLWKKVPEKPTPAPSPASPEPPHQPLNLPALSESKLSDLAWSLDIKERTIERK